MRCSSTTTSEARAQRLDSPWRRVSLALALAVTLGLAACSPGKKAFHATDVTGAEFGREFSLVDHAGKPRTLADFRGKVVAVFFGYTQCPDVCPTTLATMSQVMKLLGPRADQVQVLFVTVDPERDTADLLSRYVPAFDPRFLGLLTDIEGTARVAKEFKVFYQKVAGGSPGVYTVDHTAATYVYDPTGRLRLFVKHGAQAEQIAEDFTRLLDGA